MAKVSVELDAALNIQLKQACLDRFGRIHGMQQGLIREALIAHLKKPIPDQEAAPQLATEGETESVLESRAPEASTDISEIQAKRDSFVENFKKDTELLDWTPETTSIGTNGEILPPIEEEAKPKADILFDSKAPKFDHEHEEPHQEMSHEEALQKFKDMLRGGTNSSDDAPKLNHEELEKEFEEIHKRALERNEEPQACGMPSTMIWECEACHEKIPLHRSKKVQYCTSCGKNKLKVIGQV